jgi:glyoxylase-like metal-dependent hydrolase (beta-lactamase superfamily II)
MQEIKNIGNRFWYMTPVSETDRPILGMVTGDKKTLMIDAGNSEAHASLFLDMLATKEVGKPDLIVLTHWHWDHIFGLSGLKNALSISSSLTKSAMEKLQNLTWSDEALDQRVKEGTEIEFCSDAIKKEYEEHRDINIVLPDITFEDKLEIDLGGVHCIVQHVGGDHARDSVIVYIKEEKILFLGDSIYPDIFSRKRNYTPSQTLSLLDTLDTFDAEFYILSHWKPISKNEFQIEARMLGRMSYLCDRLNGNYKEMLIAYEAEVNRKLSEDELETLEFFVNGFELNNPL